MAAVASDSMEVEQAPNTPMNGTASVRAAKVEEMIWFIRSPPTRNRTWSMAIPAFFAASCAASSNRARSAFSQLSWPMDSSSWTWSKSAASGPWPSNGPTTVPVARMTGRRSNSQLCRPMSCMASFPPFDQLGMEHHVDDGHEEGGDGAEDDDRAGHLEHFAADAQHESFAPVFDGGGGHGVGKTRHRHRRARAGPLGDFVVHAEPGQQHRQQDHGGHRRIAGFLLFKSEPFDVDRLHQLADHANKAADEERPHGVGERVALRLGLFRKGPVLDRTSVV